MTLPAAVSASLLYQKLATDPELLPPILGLRVKSEALAATLVRDAAMFTDHTIRHMDALWSVTEKVFTATEIDAMSPAEAFLLASGFYLHDIGMSYAATAEGRKFLEATPDYASVLSQATTGSALESVKANALAYAIRIHHAHIAEKMAVDPIPGTTDYLLEPKSIREQFGAHCGKVAASHHWNVDRVESELGAKGVTPLAGNRSADLGFVAGALRLIDYAHINRERALPMERQLRGTLGAESAVHWDAQQNVDGPQRNDQTNELVYASSGPVSNVESWWLFYEFARGLSKEINQVRRFLESRRCSSGRLSLVGVQSTSTPEDFAKLVVTDGFLPLEVSVKASSINRLVQLLAGESLYGRNLFAPIRELVQNALDAILLKRATAVTDADKLLCNLPIKVSLQTAPTDSVLSVSDWGVGMTKKVLSEHLMTIASDYWEGQFHVDFPKASDSFSPAGKFGIGFLSVFMLGRKIEVFSQRTGNDRFHLTIHGLGKRAELRQVATNGSSGSEVTIHLSPEVVEEVLQLPQILPALIPMLDVQVELDTNGVVTNIPPRWVLQLPNIDFKKWVRDSRGSFNKSKNFHRNRSEIDYFVRIPRFRETTEYTAELEAKVWPDGTPEYREEGVRLLADRSGQSALCLRGFSLETIHTPGFTGVINSNTVTPDAARKLSLDFDVQPFLVRAISHTRSAITKNLTKRKGQGFIPEQIEFVSWCVSVYGFDVLKDSEFPWVQVVDPSGDSRFLSSGEVNDMLANVDAIYLGTNIGTGALSKRWRLQTQIPNRRELGICFAKAAGIEYITGEERSGRLDELWPKSEHDSLFTSFLLAVSEAWCTSIPDLLSNTEMSHKTDEIYGFISRPALLSK